MRKKLLWLILPIGLLFLSKISTQQTKIITIPQTATPPAQVIMKRSLAKSVFIPYWSDEIREGNPPYDSYYYFGVRPTKEGEIDEDKGFEQITLVEAIPSRHKELVLRMLDASVNEVILKDKNVQKTLISKVKNILIKKSFSGLILDLEVPFTFQANKQNQITQFVQQMCTDLKSDYKTCGMLIYGDFSFRKRPYDLKKLSLQVDKILLMAYDFHKAGGEPGPNFPLDRRSPPNRKGEGGFDYGYDFKQMISDAASLVPKEKIEVVFGMYGYDWTLNEQGTPLKIAQALSVNSIKLKVESLKLKVEKNEAKEKSITYRDSEGYTHIIWYEDEESVAVKTMYLQSQGIGKTSYWAYGYY